MAASIAYPHKNQQEPSEIRVMWCAGGGGGGGASRGFLSSGLAFPFSRPSVVYAAGAMGKPLLSTLAGFDKGAERSRAERGAEQSPWVI